MLGPGQLHPRRAETPALTTYYEAPGRKCAFLNPDPPAFFLDTCTSVLRIFQAALKKKTTKPAVITTLRLCHICTVMSPCRRAKPFNAMNAAKNAQQAASTKLEKKNKSFEGTKGFCSPVYPGLFGKIEKTIQGTAQSAWPLQGFETCTHQYTATAQGHRVPMLKISSAAAGRTCNEFCLHMPLLLKALSTPIAQLWL